MRVGLITLGCDKNTVDNEYLAGFLENRGCEVVFVNGDAAPEGLDAVVVTTCGFIGDAKKQSIETLVRLAESKRDTGFPRRVFAAGCLTQRYADDLLKELPELDGLAGVGQFEQLTDMILETSVAGEPRRAVQRVPAVNIEKFMARRRSEDKPHAFLKISDGCNHGCAFCSIPLMKGRLRSVPVEILLQEARSLLDQGVRELILVAQDLAAYGRDWGQGYRLPRLLRELCALDGDFWVRCMYCYPAGVTEDFIEAMASEPKIVPYLDVPLQHLDPDLLRKMKRPSAGANTSELVKRLRDNVPGIALRTTMIVGFPGESRQAHLRMLEGIRELRFDWLGAFQYSPEDGTPAAVAERQIGKAAKERRWHAVMQTQAEITRERNRQRVGTRTRVLVEDFDGERGLWVGRSPSEAPEVDGSIFLGSPVPLNRGQFVTAEITEALDYDVVGRPL